MPRSAFLVALFSAARLASAHQPHDPLDTVVISPFFSVDRTVFVVSDSDHFDRSTDGGFTWTQMVSGLDTGTPYSAVAVSPDYLVDQTVFVGTKGDGVYRSVNGGATWQNVSDGLATEGVSLIVLPPDFGAESMFLAAGVDGGLYKAEGAEVSWRQVMDRTVRITALALSPGFPQDDFIAAGDDQGRLYFSFDHGDSWSRRARAIGSTPLTAIAVSPEFENDGTIFVGSLGEGVYRSSDRGATFRRINFGLSDRRITAIALSPAFATDSTVFACGAQLAVFRSSNRGGTWRKFDDGLYRRDQGVVHNRALAISDGFAGDGTVFLAAFEGLFRSANRGRSWLELEVAKPADKITGIALSAEGLDRTLWVSTYGGGVHQQSRSGEWSAQNRGLERPYVYDIAVSPGFPTDSSIFGLQLDFIAKSTDGGSVWSLTKIAPTEEVFPTSITLSPSYLADQTILLGSRYTGIFRSTNGGSTYANVFPQAGFVVSLAVSPTFDSDGTAFAGTFAGGVYKSTDHGASWAQANTSVGTTILALAISPAFAADRTLFAGTLQGLYRTLDGGASWERATFPGDVGDPPVLEVAVSPDFSRDGLALAALRGAGTFRTLDHGVTWDEIALDLTTQGFLMEHIRFSPSFAADGTLYGSSGAALFQSTNRGMSWSGVPHPVRYESQNDMIRFREGWRSLRSEPSSSYDLAYSDRPGGQCIFRFVGTGVSWIGPRSPLQGIAQVYVDDVFVATVDAYASSTSYQETPFAAHGLPRGPHVLRIDVTGEKRPEADVANVVVDAFDVVR